MAEEKKRVDSDAIRKEVVSVGRHSSIYVVGQALSRAVGFFMIPIYTRFIAPTNYGAMEMIEIISGAIALIVLMGVSESMSRFYYGEEEESKRDEIVSTAGIGLGLLGIPIVLSFIGLSSLLSKVILEDPQYRYYLQLGIAAVWFSMLCEIGYTYLRMLYKAKLFVTITMAQLFIALSLNIYFVVFQKLDILGIFYSTLITQGLTGFFLSIWLIKKVRLRFSISVLWQLIKYGAPLIPSRVGLMIGFVSNRFFLRWLGSPDPAVALAQIGLFSLGHKFAVIIERFVTVPFNSFWGPRRIELLLGEGASAKESVARMCTYATMCSVYLSLILSAGIESLLKIIADPAYKGAHVVVPFAALSYVALGLETHFMSGILIQKKTHWTAYITVLSVMTVLAWNYLFVSRWGIIGAATSNLAGFVVRVSLIYLVSQRLFWIPFEMKRMAIMLITAFLLYVFSQGITFSSPYLTFICRTCFVGLFPVPLLFLRFYTKGELVFAKQTALKGLAALGVNFPEVNRA